MSGLQSSQCCRKNPAAYLGWTTAVLVFSESCDPARRGAICPTPSARTPPATIASFAGDERVCGSRLWTPLREYMMSPCKWSTRPLSACISTVPASTRIEINPWDGHGVDWPAKFMRSWIQTACRPTCADTRRGSRQSTCQKAAVSPETGVAVACRSWL